MDRSLAIVVFVALCAGTGVAQEPTTPQPTGSFCYRLFCENPERQQGLSESTKVRPQDPFNRYPSGTHQPVLVAQDVSLEERVLKEVPLLGPLALTAWRRHYSVGEWYGRAEGFTLLHLAGGQFAIDLEKQRVFLPGGERRYSVTLRLNLNQLSRER